MSLKNIVKDYKSMHVLVLSSQDGDWEGLFINGKLIDEAHTLGEGGSKTYMLEMSEKFEFHSSDVSFEDVNDDDNQELYDSGTFPSNLDKMHGNYK